MKQVVCFYIPEPRRGDIKLAKTFINCMKSKFISDSFYHMLNSYKHKKNTDLSSFSPILLPKTCQRRCATYDVIANCDVSAYQKAAWRYVINLFIKIAIFYSRI